MHRAEENSLRASPHKPLGLLLLLPMRIGKLLIGYRYPESPELQVLSS